MSELLYEVLFTSSRNTSNHGREITIAVDKTPDAVCTVCACRSSVIAFDASEGEYDSVEVCKACLARLLENL